MNEVWLKKKRKIDKKSMVLLSFGLIVLMIGVSYAFFVYNKTGLYTHTINGGKMKVIYDELAGNNITIENAYPLTDEEAETKSLEFEFTITGYNESDKNVYYSIEMDHGEDVTSKNRFLDRDIKLTLYENEKLVFENQIYENLDNQDIHYGHISSGTSADNPTVNDYMMRVWINDNVYISDTVEDDISLWDEMDYNWAKEALFLSQYNRISSGLVSTLDELGISVYTSEEFANSYANFKVNVHADLSYDNVGYLTYDANGGEYTPKPTSLTTGRITLEKPVKEGKGFLGWSGTKNGEVEYYSGDVYTGTYDVLYAIYSDNVNIMSDLIDFNTYRSNIQEVYFINEPQEDIDSYASEVLLNGGTVIDLTHEDYEDTGIVTGILDGNTLYVASEGTTYLSTGNNLFYDYESTYKFEFINADTSMVTDMSGMFETARNEPGPTSNPENEIKQNDLIYRNEKNKSNKIEDEEEYDSILDLSGFNTSWVTSMEGMFKYFGQFTEINLDNFDTSNVANMVGMFNMCTNLTTVILDKFDTSRITDMSYMFSGCNSLVKLDLSSFDTSKVTNMTSMFNSCYNLINLDISSFDTSNVITTNFVLMFSRNNTNAIIYVANEKEQKVILGLSDHKDYYGNSNRPSEWTTDNVIVKTSA